MARNLISDVPGVRVGHAQDARLATGVTVILFNEPAIGSIDVRGGGPGTRETDLLDPQMSVQRIDAITLSGGSAFGLDAPSGVQAFLREQGRGYQVGTARVPIVPGAILFDLLNGARQGLGPLPALSRARLYGGGERGRGVRARQRRRWDRGDHSQSQRRHWISLSGDRRWFHGRRGSGDECRRERCGR